MGKWFFTSDANKAEKLSSTAQSEDILSMHQSATTRQIM